MKRQTSPKASRITRALAQAAGKIPEVSTGLACAGTALESQTFIVAKKAFLFLGPKEARLKLQASLAEATRLADEFGDALRVGTGGWITIRVTEDRGPDAKTLARWVKESHDLMADKPRKKAGGKRGS